MKIINLLPKTKQQELRYETMLHSLWVLLSLSLVSFVLVFVLQFFTKFYLQIQASVLDQEIAQLQGQVNKQENAEVKAKVKAANDVIGDFQNLAKASPKWSKVIKAFVPLPPEGVSITTFAIDPQHKAISITGLSPTRELVIQLYNNILQDSQDFYNIDYPLENVAAPTNVNFHFTFYIQDQLLK